jgi:hypothetical protein
MAADKIGKISMFSESLVEIPLAVSDIIEVKDFDIRSRFMATVAILIIPRPECTY